MLPTTLLARCRAFRMPDFTPGPLEFDPVVERGVGAIVVEIERRPEPDAPGDAPTPGELHQAIERHLQTARSEGRQADPGQLPNDVQVRLRRSVG
ncbi:hypothetical protein H8M03_03870 [Sphingomonas sabuli]|uniref:Uncharacterized protein n=1 Tax=Sphingomonas sabuli TaxID=2764186 RepID=A0A7G9L4D3_9SPHN|nr:hypothetical protein [Sphingomonas sabuli]QNM83482.1 hypothetical protein H8M03_03870 [Sphingomonas sabuli]